MFSHGGKIASRNTVSPNVSLFEMRDCDRQHVAIPLGRGKPTPGMRRICRGMRTPIQVVNVVNRAQPLCVESRDLPGDGVNFLCNAELGGTTPDVIGRMRPALPFRHALD